MNSDDEETSTFDLARELQHDPDYLNWVKDTWTPWFAKRFATKVDPEVAYIQWRDQKTICGATGLLMTVPQNKHDKRTAYTATIVVCDKKKPMSAPGNIVYVVRFAAQMYNSLHSLGVMTLDQFYALTGFVKE